MNQPRIAFFGTPDLCIPILNALKEAGYTPAHIITNPDRPVGRKQILTPPPVKIWAHEQNIAVHQPIKLDDDFTEWYRNAGIDIAIVVAYGKIIPQEIITIPTHDTLNIHYSLLPRWRGASPVETALLHGDTETGVCIQKMVYELDAGDILAQEKITIGTHETAPELLDRLNRIGARLLINLIPDYITGRVRPYAQDPTYITHCSKIKKSDGEISLTHMSSEELWNRYRAYFGWPGIFFFDAHNKRVKITRARMENDNFIIEKVIPEGKKEIDFEVYNGIL